MDIEGQPPAVKESDKIALPLRAVTPDYFKLMGMPLMDGREFRSTDDDKAPNVAIVNQAFARPLLSAMATQSDENSGWTAEINRASKSSARSRTGEPTI